MVKKNWRRVMGHATVLSTAVLTTGCQSTGVLASENDQKQIEKVMSVLSNSKKEQTDGKIQEDEKTVEEIHKSFEFVFLQLLNHSSGKRELAQTPLRVCSREVGLWLRISKLSV